MTERLLIIDDDAALCDLLRSYLEPHGFDVDTEHRAEDGLRRLQAAQPALIILDVMLPEVDGFDALRRIRSTFDTPVIMLTARGEDTDRIVGLELGADDYLTKPFNPRELHARIKAILRRQASLSPGSAPNGSKPLVLGDLAIDYNAREVRRNGEAVSLTGAEFALLNILVRSAGRAVERQQLSQQVLGRRLAPYDRSIDVHISNLRKKLGHHCGPRERIRTVRGVGYIYNRSGTAPRDG